MPEGAIYAVQKQVRTVTATVTTSTQKILDSNNDRKGCILFNDSEDSIYLTYGPTAALTNSTYIVGPYEAWDLPGPAVWCGEIAAIREAGSGSIVITEEI